VLHIKVPPRYANRSESRNGDQYGVDARATRTPRMVKRRDQEDDAKGGDGDALEDAQGAGIESQLELRVQRVSQQTCAGTEAQEIVQSTIFQHGENRTLPLDDWH
jgi:hypothetical protein